MMLMWTRVAHCMQDGAQVPVLPEVLPVLRRVHHRHLHPHSGRSLRRHVESALREFRSMLHYDTPMMINDERGVLLST